MIIIDEREEFYEPKKFQPTKHVLVDNTDVYKVGDFESNYARNNYDYYNPKQTLLFEMYDESLINLGVKKGDVLAWKRDFAVGFDPLDYQCRYVFIVSLPNGELVARMVDTNRDGDFILKAANSKIADLVIFPDEIDIVGKVEYIKRFTLRKID